MKTFVSMLLLAAGTVTVAGESVAYVESLPGEAECPAGSTEITEEDECPVAVASLGYTINTQHPQYVGETCNFPNGCSVMGTWNSDGSLADSFSSHFLAHYGDSGVVPHFSPPSKTCGSGRSDQKRVCRVDQATSTTTTTTPTTTTTTPTTTTTAPTGTCDDWSVEFEGWCYATMDQCDPDSAAGTCSCPGCSSACQNVFLPLPAGWSLVPYDADNWKLVSYNVVATHLWGTNCLVFGDGKAFRTKNIGSSGWWCGGSSNGNSVLLTSGSTYKTYCNRKVLMRRLAASPPPTTTTPTTTTTTTTTPTTTTTTTPTTTTTTTPTTTPPTTTTTPATTFAPGTLNPAPTVVTAGNAHSLAIRTDGSIAAWGKDNYNQVSNTPSTHDFLSVAGGESHSVALRTDGTLVAWGWNNWGVVSNTPKTDGFVALDARNRFSLALRSDGSLKAWGWHGYGVLNIPTTNDFVKISAGAHHGMAIRTDGSLAAWGLNHWGQVADTPTTADFVSVSAGWKHSVALRSDGTLVAWGCDANNNQVSTTPTTNDFIAVSTGGLHAVALRADGTVVSWGSDNQGQVSDTPTTNDFVAVYAGYKHSVALRSDGSLVSWGLDGDWSIVTDTPTTNDFLVPGLTTTTTTTTPTTTTTTTTKAPTRGPTKAPTRGPTKAPTRGPTKAPTHGPTEAPTRGPTKAPTHGPTEAPTHSPSKSPTHSPTDLVCLGGEEKVDVCALMNIASSLQFCLEHPGSWVCECDDLLMSYWTTVGNPDVTNVPDEVKSVAGTATVRCCSMQGDSCTSEWPVPADFVGAAGTQADGCFASQTHAQAEEICSARGQRLCSMGELKAGVCSGTGCGFDNDLVWTSTEAGAGAHVTVTGITHPWGFPDGKYFYFAISEWTAMTGSPPSGNWLVDHYRNGALVDSSLQVRVWDNENGVHGRKHPISQAAAGDWQIGDIVKNASPSSRRLEAETEASELAAPY